MYGGKDKRPRVSRRERGFVFYLETTYTEVDTGRESAMADTSTISDLRSVIQNVIGGALVVLLTWGYGWLVRRCRQWALKRLMGADFDRDGQYHIVYGSFVLSPIRDQNGNAVTHPYIKTPLPPSVPRRPATMSFSIDNPVSGGEMRSSAYLAGLFGKGSACTPVLVPDIDIVSRVDLSFISLGGPASNLKTEDALAHPVNALVTMSLAGFVKPGTQQPVMPIVPDPEFDYGIILRISPTQHPSRTWIVCAGLGEWGTSGTSWFLANKWPQLLWHVLKCWRHNYAALIRVRRGQDESAEMIWAA
jgi:hypothetical protein